MPHATRRAETRHQGQRPHPARSETLWLYGLHAVRDALENTARRHRRLILTRNAADRLGEALAGARVEPEIVDARRFTAPLEPQSVHQGAALETDPLDWGPLAGHAERALSAGRGLVALDRVTDPHNVGAILRSAEVFGAAAVLAPRHHSAPETGALAKSASGALERQPYLRVRNLGDALEELRTHGFRILGLDGSAETDLPDLLDAPAGPVCLVLGAEGPGLRQRTREICDSLVRIPSLGAFGSLNVSNAAAVALYALSRAKA